jgi:hypothetical protein
MIDAEVSKWLDRMSIAESNQESAFKKFSEWYDDFYAIVKNQVKGRSNAYFPKLTAKVWQLVPKMVMGGMGFKVKSRGSDPEVEAANAIESLLDYQYDNPDFDEPMSRKLADVLLDSLVTGKGLALIPWTTRDIEFKEQNTQMDEFGEQSLSLGETKVTKFTDSFPDFQPVNIFDAFFSPAGTTLQKKHWIIIKDWKTLDELKKMNSETGDKMFKNLETLKDFTQSKDKYSQYKNSQSLMTDQDPVSADNTINSVEIWHCFEKAGNKFITIAPEAKQVLRKITNPYWHGEYPLVDFEVKPRPHQFWGEGIFEISLPLQKLSNSQINHYFDAVNISTDPMILSGENTTILDYFSAPGAIVQYQGEKPEFVKMVDANPQGLQIAGTFIDRAIDSLTIEPYAAGQTNSETDNTKGTKGGIIALQQAADDVLGFMRNSFKTSIRKVGTYWMRMDQQFLDRILYIEDIVAGEKIQKEIDPAKIQGMYSVAIDDELDKASDPETEKENFMMLIDQTIRIQGEAAKQAAAEQPNEMGVSMPLPIKVDWQKVLEEMYSKFGVSDDFLQGEDAEEEMGMPGMPMEMPMEMPVEQPQMPQVAPEMPMPTQVPQEMPQEQPSPQGFLQWLKEKGGGLIGR